MRLTVLFTLILLLGACRKENPDAALYTDYLRIAAAHCNCPVEQLDWLREITASGQHTRPTATVPAPIHTITLSTHQGQPAFILDSFLNSCIPCPWEVLDCEGNSLDRDYPVVRGAVIWELKL